MTQTQYIIEVQSTDWLQQLDILVVSHRKDEKDMFDHMQMSVAGPDCIVYAIDKEWLPAEKLAKMLGVTVAAVNDTKVITLKPLKGSEGWQTPTVPYYGRA